MWTRPYLSETGMPARQLGHPCGLLPWVLASVGGRSGSLGHEMEGGGSGVEGQGATAVPSCLGILALAANFVSPRQAGQVGRTRE